MGLFDFFIAKPDNIQTRRPDYKILDEELEKEEQTVKNTKTVAKVINFRDAKIGDFIIIDDISYELGDIILYSNKETGEKFYKYELTSEDVPLFDTPLGPLNNEQISDEEFTDKVMGMCTSIWLKVEQNAIYKFTYTFNFSENIGDNVVYNKETYNFVKEGVFDKESERTYDDANDLDKTCEYCEYKNSRNDIILIEEVNEYIDTSVGSLIMEINISAQRAIKV
ncbi:MAG TPA: hypothetical protein DEP72_04910 [Clostridiales bacterium]|nr:MAG: hypothetical protein A2Y18_02015 [Clostridiales bacterium GWD2_32_19]HCC07480.1 hypothetical protein [Clostridiales bacterium]